MMEVSAGITLVEIIAECDIPVAQPYDSGYLRARGIMKQGKEHIVITKPYEKK